MDIFCKSYHSSVDFNQILLAKKYFINVSKTTYIFQSLLKNSFGPKTYSFKTISIKKILRKNQSASSMSKPIIQAFRNIMKSKKIRKNLRIEKKFTFLNKYCSKYPQLIFINDANLSFRVCFTISV